MKHILKKVIIVMFISLIFTNCTTPKRAVRIEDRLWIENDYDSRLKKLTIDYRIDRVLTRFGHTQILVAGEQNEKAVIFLHAMGLNLTSWLPNIEVLSKYYKIIAIDMIGDQGRSIVRRDYPETITEYGLWLNDIITNYKIETVNIAGCSMGGWIAHGYAIQYPEKIETLTLISPAAGIPAKTTWLGLILKMITTNDEKKLEKIAQKILGNRQAQSDWIEYMGKASKDYKSAKLGMPKNFSDEEIRKTGGKILLLIGEEDKIYKSSENVFKKAKAVRPDIVCKLIPDASHIGGWDNPNFVNTEIINLIGAE